MSSSESAVTDKVFPTIVEGDLRAISGLMKDVEEVRVGVIVIGILAADVGAVLVCTDVSLAMMQNQTW
jgi:hypothetical protein